MAIGLPLATPPFPRLRHSWRQFGTHFAHHTRILKARLLSVVSTTRVLWQRMANSTQSQLHSSARARQRQRIHLAAFEQRYEGLIGLLCIAAHEGVRPDRQLEYTQIRAWMRANYPLVAGRLRAHWDESEPKGSDPFVALFRYPSLEETVNAESGIEDITRSRMALEAYRATLDTTAL